jgi:3-oxoacyl-[acyl-carrier protein] reductase
MSENSNSFKGTTVLVTGASSGIGAATAIAFASRGAHILAHYNRQEKEAADVLARVQGAGGSGELLRADLSRMEGVRDLAQDVTGRPVDILVNNAGSLLRRARVMEFTEELWNEVMTLNLDSAFFLAQAVLRGMAERKRGFIVNVSSVAARNGGGLGALAYATAKGALSTMTKGLAKEFAPIGVRVNAVSPGTVETNYHRQFSTEQMLSGVKAATPMGRLGTSEEIANVILFLCSPEARFIQGQVVEVNGGFLMA